MSEDKINKDQDLKIALEGYRAAIEIYLHQTTQIWDRCNAMVLANSIFIAAISLNITSQLHLKSFSYLFLAGGFSICVIWLFLVSRGFDYQDYYVYKARKIEQDYFLRIVNTLYEGRSFSNGDQTIKIEFHDGDKYPKENWLSRERIARGRNASYIIVFIFMVIYFVLFYLEIKPYLYKSSFYLYSILMAK